MFVGDPVRLRRAGEPVCSASCRSAANRQQSARIVTAEVSAMAKGRRSQWTWVYDPKSQPGSKPPDNVKQEVSEAAETILAEWRQRYIKPVPKNYQWNYLTQLYGRWRGNYFTFGG